MTDSHDTSKQAYVKVFVDSVSIAESKFRAGQGPPIVWTPLSGGFTAGSNSLILKVFFVATIDLGATWGLDNVVTTPA